MSHDFYPYVCTSRSQQITYFNIVQLIFVYNSVIFTNRVFSCFYPLNVSQRTTSMPHVLDRKIVHALNCLQLSSNCIDTNVKQIPLKTRVYKLASFIFRKDSELELEKKTSKHCTRPFQHAYGLLVMQPKDIHSNGNDYERFDSRIRLTEEIILKYYLQDSYENYIIQANLVSFDYRCHLLTKHQLSEMVFERKLLLAHELVRSLRMQGRMHTTYETLKRLSFLVT